MTVTHKHLAEHVLVALIDVSGWAEEKGWPREAVLASALETILNLLAFKRGTDQTSGLLLELASVLREGGNVEHGWVLTTLEQLAWQIASTGAEHARCRSTTTPRSAARNKLQFRGSIGELQDLVLLTGDNGEWEEKPNGLWRYRSEDGGGLNWSSTRGTLWFDGPPEPRARLQRLVEARLG